VFAIGYHFISSNIDIIKLLIYLLVPLHSLSFITLSLQLTHLFCSGFHGPTLVVLLILKVFILVVVIVSLFSWCSCSHNMLSCATPGSLVLACLFVDSFLSSIGTRNLSFVLSLINSICRLCATQILLKVGGTCH